MTSLAFAMIAVLAGTIVAATSLGRVQRETEDLLDGYARALNEARERHRRELEFRRTASKASTPRRANSAGQADEAGPAA